MHNLLQSLLCSNRNNVLGKCVFYFQNSRNHYQSRQPFSEYYGRFLAPLAARGEDQGAAIYGLLAGTATWHTLGHLLVNYMGNDKMECDYGTSIILWAMTNWELYGKPSMVSV